MHGSHFKQIAAIFLLFFWTLSPRAGAAESTQEPDSPGRGDAGLELDAAKHFLSLIGNASIGVNRSLLSSVDLNATSTENGDSDALVKSDELGVTLSHTGKIFSAGLGAVYENDDKTRTALGGKFNLGWDWDCGAGISAGLALSGGSTRFSAAQGATLTASSSKGKATVNDSVAITQYSPALALNIGFFDDLADLSCSSTRYRYQNYVVGSNLAGNNENSDAAAGLTDTLVSGFYDWVWSLGLKANLPRKWCLAAIYTQSLSMETQAWTKSLETDLSKDFGIHVNAMAGIVHATENGSGDNTFKTAATVAF
jgi:hypothetical protein